MKEIKVNKKDWANVVESCEILQKRGFYIEIGESMYSLFVKSADHDRILSFL